MYEYTTNHLLSAHLKRGILEIANAEKSNDKALKCQNCWTIPQLHNNSNTDSGLLQVLLYCELGIGLVFFGQSDAYL